MSDLLISKICKNKDGCVHPDGPELLRKDFARVRTNDGRSARCQKCLSQSRAEQKRNYYLTNKEHTLNIHKEYRKNNVEKK